MSETEKSNNSFGHEARQLTDEEIAKLISDKEIIAPFRQQKLEKDAKKNWDCMYLYLYLDTFN